MGQRSSISIPAAPGFIARAVMIVLVMIISLGMPLAASAQTLRGTSFTTSTNDHTIAWNENWNASLEGDDEFSTMVMLEGQIMIYAVMFIHDPLVGLNAKSVYYSLSGVLTGSFDSTPTHTVEWEGEDGSFHGAHLINLSGIDFVLYLRVDPSASGDSGPIMQLAAAPVRAFPISLEAMQSEISIDDETSLAGDDGEDILARLTLETADTSTPVESAADTSADAESMPARSASPRDRGRLPSGVHDQPSQPASSEYVSVANGFTVTYDTAWQDMAADNATVGEFSLTDSDSSRAVVSFSGRSTTETNRDAFFQDIVQRESRYEGYVGSVVTDDRLLIATWTTENQLAVLEYVFVTDTTVVTIMVTVSSSSPDRYIDAVRGIQLDGEDILRDWEQVWPQD